MPAPRPWVGRSALHLFGKLLDAMSPEEMTEWGFTAREIDTANSMFDDLDAWLNEEIGKDWEEVEVL